MGEREKERKREREGAKTLTLAHFYLFIKIDITDRQVLERSFRWKPVRGSVRERKRERERGLKKRKKRDGNRGYRARGGGECVRERERKREWLRDRGERWVVKAKMREVCGKCQEERCVW